MTIYVDEQGYCHVENADGRQPVEAKFFDGRAPEVIEGYLYTLDDGGVEVIAPWRDWNELDKAQRAYEQNLITQYEAALSAIEQALEVQT